MYKKIFIYTCVAFISILIFLLFDFFLSKYTNLFHIRKNCVEYYKIENNNKKYYSYGLAKNCKAFEHKGKTPAYTVYTNNQGYRIGKKNINNLKKNSKEKIIFLGDSFTYGFGVDYENSLPGLVEKKTNYQFEVINLGVAGYSPLMNLFKLKEYLSINQNKNIKKIFYILDITDVHDESNRWIKLNDIEIPVIIDRSVKKEIKNVFALKEKFRSLRFFSYLINKNLRNLKKTLKKPFSKEEKKDYDGTFWGKFTHTKKQILEKDEQYQALWTNDLELGFENINENILEISKLAKIHNAEFYISIHPWRETMELGQKEFSWEDFGKKICLNSNCKKLINFFEDVKMLKNVNKNWKSELYFKEDLHHTKKGNQLYSNRIIQDAFR